ncbi:unnamed protein product [Blepharisma stoltei]|uniref:Uncharacterized protein n=1 Tax=Blepharisma stoltei TaxID=1481888 RepID=A0AAU9JDM8_9CILI|nr:unnamed protein product [Blepharisma stoltei]
MDFLRVIIGLLPQSLGGRIAYGAAGALGVGYILSYPYNYIHYHRVEKYQLSVCWEHYLAYFQATEEHYKHSPREINRRLMLYNECIQSARSGGKTYPPAL